MNKNSTKNVIIGILVVLLLIGGVYVYSKYNKEEVDNGTITPTSTTTGTETNTPPTKTTISAPTVVTASQAVPSISTVVLTGKVTPNGSQTTYWYEYGKTSSLGTRTNAKAIGSGFIAISAPEYITGLSSNTKYYFRLSAQNSLGVVNGGVYTFSTNNNPPPQANVPKVETNSANSISRTTVKLNGKVTPNNSDTSYWFEYGETKDLGSLTTFSLAGNGSTAVPVSASVSGLKALTKYYFRVNAQNQYGTVVGTTLEVTTQGPSNPGLPGVTTNNATAITNSSAVLNGRVNSNGSDTEYWFEYYPDIAFPGIIPPKTTPKKITGLDSGTIVVSAKIEGLDKNMKYTFRIVAKNENGTQYGNSLEFKTPLTN